MNKSSKKRNKARSKRKNTPPVVPMPPGVGYILDLIASLPSDAKSFDEMGEIAKAAIPVDLQSEDRISEYLDKYQTLSFELLLKTINEISPAGRAFIGDFNHPNEARFNYAILRSIRESVRRMIEAEGEAFYPFYDGDIKVRSGYLRVNDEGHLELVIDPDVTAWIVNLLQGVDVRYIKKCPICHTIFWAGRKDKRACSEKCSAVLRVQINRGKWPQYAKAKTKKKKRGAKPPSSTPKN